MKIFTSFVLVRSIDSSAEDDDDVGDQRRRWRSEMENKATKAQKKRKSTSRKRDEEGKKEKFLVSIHRNGVIKCENMMKMLYCDFLIRKEISPFSRYKFRCLHCVYVRVLNFSAAQSEWGKHLELVETAELNELESGCGARLGNTSYSGCGLVVDIVVYIFFFVLDVPHFPSRDDLIKTHKGRKVAPWKKFECTQSTESFFFFDAQCQIQSVFASVACREQFLLCWRFLNCFTRD